MMGNHLSSCEVIKEVKSKPKHPGVKKGRPNNKIPY